MNRLQSCIQSVHRGPARRAWRWPALGLALLTTGGTLVSCKSESRATEATSAAVESRALRIGTYDSRAVAIAYGRSIMFKKTLDDLVARRNAAVAAGNERLASELAERGELQQIRLHLQAFSTAPVEDAIEQVRDRLPTIAARMNLGALVPITDYHDPSVELVDVTDEIVRLFDPDEATMKIVRDCRRQKPAAIETIARLPASE